MSVSRYVLPLLASSVLMAQAVSTPWARLLESSVAPGGLLVVVAQEAPGQSLRVRFRDKLYPFFPHPADPGHRAAVLVPIPVDSAPGPDALEIETGTHDQPLHLPFAIDKTVFPTIAVKIAPRIAQPSAADQARAQREREEILQIYAEPTLERQWSAPFLDPLKARITCGFGVKRSFNGVVLSVHKGLDLRAAQGTPVHATAAGIVRLAKNLFYGGNLVILDHGCGLFTTYAHLSRTDVQVGQRVQAGQLLGLSGATGRVSGPHLHWGASISGTDIRPTELKRCTALLTSRKLP